MIYDDIFVVAGALSFATNAFPPHPSRVSLFISVEDAREGGKRM
jgi:hypothetical protein